MRFFIELSYSGSNYHGWQIQPNANTVQEELTKALSTILSDVINVVGAGRTDTGVHAKQMFAHFDAEVEMELPKLITKLNGFLPNDIAIHNIFKVNADYSSNTKYGPVIFVGKDFIFPKTHVYAFYFM